MPGYADGFYWNHGIDAADMDYSLAILIVFVEHSTI